MIELVGTSAESWEKAAAAAVERAAASLRDLRVAEVVELDMVLEDGKVKELPSLRNFLHPSENGISDLPPFDIPKHSGHALTFRVVKVDKSI